MLLQMTQACDDSAPMSEKAHSYAYDPPPRDARPVACED